MPDHSSSEEIFPNTPSKPPLMPPEAIASHPITSYLGEETNTREGEATLSCSPCTTHSHHVMVTGSLSTRQQVTAAVLRLLHSPSPAGRRKAEERADLASKPSLGHCRA